MDVFADEETVTNPLPGKLASEKWALFSSTVTFQHLELFRINVRFLQETAELDQSTKILA